MMSASVNRFALLDPETSAGGSDNASTVTPTTGSSGRDISIIFIKRDRERGNEDPRNPPFLSQFAPNRTPEMLRAFILPYIASCLFILESQVDINYLAKIVNLYGAAPHITKVVFNGFYWFSGIRENRRANPALAFATQLPYLTDVALVFHVAGFTESSYTERDRLRIEAGNLEQSKSLRCKRLTDVVDFYDMRRLLQCPSLQVLRTDLIKSEIVDNYCTQGEPVSVYRDVIYWCRQNLQERLGRSIRIEARIDGQLVNT